MIHFNTYAGSHNVFYYHNQTPTTIFAKYLVPGDVLVGGSGRVLMIFFINRCFETVDNSGQGCEEHCSCSQDRIPGPPDQGRNYCYQ